MIKWLKSLLYQKNLNQVLKELYGYPFTICSSVDNQVVHGLPNKDKLFEGQIISIDVGSIYNDYFGDHAKTFAVGKIDNEKEKLLRVTEECLYKGIEKAKVNNKIGDISNAISKNMLKSMVMELLEN